MRAAAWGAFPYPSFGRGTARERVRRCRSVPDELIARGVRLAGPDSRARCARSALDGRCGVRRVPGGRWRPSRRPAGSNRPRARETRGLGDRGWIPAAARRLAARAGACSAWVRLGRSRNRAGPLTPVPPPRLPGPECVHATCPVNARARRSSRPLRATLAEATVGVQGAAASAL